MDCLFYHWLVSVLRFLFALCSLFEKGNLDKQTTGKNSHGSHEGNSNPLLNDNHDAFNEIECCDPQNPPPDNLMMFCKSDTDEDDDCTI